MINNSKGITLIELVLGIVIFSIAIAGVMHAITFMTRNSVTPLLIKTQQDIANNYLQQILQTSINNFDSNKGCGGNNYNEEDICYYHDRLLDKANYIVKFKVVPYKTKLTNTIQIKIAAEDVKNKIKYEIVAYKAIGLI